jgi:acetamidase/formamidase
MARYELSPTRDNVADVFTRDRPPVLTVSPGDTVVVRSFDASGYLARQQHPGDQPPTMFSGHRGHCLTGPIAVRGARPGLVLSIRFVSLRPDDWGWTVAAASDDRLKLRLGLAEGPSSWLLWDLDTDQGTGTNDLGHTVTLAPFLGVVGMPPDEPGEHSTKPPRALGGGNIDCRELVAGATLYLPVTVPDALLYMGDGHAAQGDGEVGGTAIECTMTTEAVLDLIADPPVPGIHAVTPAGRITFGFSRDLNEAMGDALEAMVLWMQSLYGLSKGTALAVASTTVDLRITQVANDVWGVHALLRDGVLRPGG